MSIAWKPINRNIIIKLPEWQKDRTRETPSGILIPHLEGRFDHNATHGTVVAVGGNCKIAQVGDEVFFPNLTVKLGLQNVGLDKTALGTHSNGLPISYLIEDGVHYLVMPECSYWETLNDRVSNNVRNTFYSGIITLIRDGEIVCCNDYHLMTAEYDAGELIEGVRIKKTDTKILQIVAGEIEENKKFYKVTHAPKDSPILAGDKVYTMPHCDLPLEGEYNYPQLPNGTYYVEMENILGFERGNASSAPDSAKPVSIN